MCFHFSLRSTRGAPESFTFSLGLRSEKALEGTEGLSLWLKNICLTYYSDVFSRRFRRKSRLLQWLVFFLSSVQRVTSTFCALMHIYQLLPYVLSTSFSTHPKPLTWDKKPFQSRRVHFFRHYETFLLFSALWDWFFSEFFLLFLPSIFDILQQNGCSKNPKASPFYIFWHYATYRKLQKNSKKIGFFFLNF